MAGVVFMTGAISARASVLSYAPATISVVQGQSVAIRVTVDPQGVPLYTAKIELNFPKNLLRADGFTQEAGWFPLVQPGYDALDNASGILIKTAGFPGGLASAKTFGTVTFTAIASGTGSITTGGNALALDAANKNTLANAPQIAVAISAPAPAPAPAPTPKPTPKPEPKPEPTPASALEPKPLPTITLEGVSSSSAPTSSEDVATSTATNTLGANLIGFITNTGNLLRLGFAIVFAAIAALLLRIILGRK